MSKQTKDKNKNKQEEIPIVNGIGQGMGLLGGMLSSNTHNPESELPPLPSTSSGNTIPVTANTPAVTTTPVATAPAAPQLPSSYSTAQGYGYSRSYDANPEERAKAEAQQIEENKKADDYNATLTGRVNALNSSIVPRKSTYDRYGRVIPSTYTPMAPLPVIPKEIEVPRMILGTDAYNENRRESIGNNGAGAIKRKAPTIASVDWKTGKIIPMSPSEVSMDTDGIVQAAMESRNPAFAVKAIADNFGNTPLPKGTMVKIPNIQYDKKTNKYVDMGEMTVDMGGNNYADNMNRIFTAHMAKNMLNDINKNPKMLKNYGTQGGSQLKFNPSVFVAGQGGVYNSTISKSIMDALGTAGIPPGTTQPIAGSMTARIVGDGKSKANETWLNAKDNNMLADTINGWGNSTANALMGYLLGVR